MNDTPLTVFTIGHSTHTIDELVEMLQAHGVTQLVDIRSVPWSRHNPQFNRDVLAEALPFRGIDYVNDRALGGFRHTTAASPNTGLTSTAFRGFADYMQTKEFRTALEGLVRKARRRRTAIMCAEANPFRCHRRLVADALVARGVRVVHISSATSARPHELSDLAVVRDGRVTYPPPEEQELRLFG